VTTVLYIEDNEANRQLVKFIIARRSDLELIDAETGREGLALAFSQRPDIILLDISLPDMSGNDVLKQLRNTPATAQTPVIAISGDPVYETRSSSPGFQEYLGKPINIQALYQALDTFLK
jgi:CheY-like chemotaxis protein